MGSKKSKINQRPLEDVGITLTVNPMGFITNASQMFLEQTGYEYRDIHQKHMANILLTGILKRLHKTIFIPKFRTAVGAEKAKLRNFIKNHMKKIMCTITTPNGLQQVFVSTSEIESDELCITIVICRPDELTVGATAKGVIPPVLRDCPIKTSPVLKADNVGIISMDLCGSTVYINEIGIGPYVASQKTLFDELQRHLNIDLFPLVRLHEVLGDSFVLTVNAPWWCGSRLHELEPFLLLVARYLTWHMNSICEKYFNGKIYIRCGIASGSVMANITGRYFRMYGKCLNIACRLESACKRDCVHVLDYESTDKIVLKGFDDEFKSSQVCALECPDMNDICELVVERHALMDSDDDRTVSYHSSKNVYTVRGLVSDFDTSRDTIHHIFKRTTL